MKKRIAIIIDNLTRKAGTERAVSNLCNGLSNHYEKLYEITIISIFSDNFQETFFEINKQIQIVHLNHPNNFSNFSKVFWYKKMIELVREVVIENQINILIGSSYVHNILLPIITRNSHIKTIGCEHEVYDFPSKWAKIVRQKVYSKLNQVVVLNKTERSYYGFLSNVTIIPNSLSFVNERKAKLNEKTIIAVGRLMHQKGFDILIEIMQLVILKNPDWKLNIFGDGEDYKMLQKLIDNQNLGNNIKLCGAVKNISEQYLKSSIFALSSRWESFGLVIIEAMNNGLPVVSFDCDGPKNIVQDGVNGFLINNFNKIEFAKKLCILIESYETRCKFAKEAILTSAQYEEKNIMSLWNQLIQNLQ
jgi:glycosyltransferase involved in cell wall biosynthesis